MRSIVRAYLIRRHEEGGFFIEPKETKTMGAFDWIVDRMKEGSTWAGFAVIAALIFGGDAATWTDLLVKFGTHVAGLIAVVAAIAAMVIKK